MTKRLRELDFLRGIAILLVLLRHIPLTGYTTNMGWIGVDLFFVLSGFLVSGLLFKEYIKFGNIDPKLFLIRRGFKIYPIYYLMYIPYIIFKIVYGGNFKVIGLLSDLTFTQNYIWGWGYANSASWSLAVEEHFYFGFAAVLWCVLNRQNSERINQKKLSSFSKVIMLLLITCLLLRITFNLFIPHQETKLFTSTHLRIDSLLFGSLIAFFYYFKQIELFNFFKRYSSILYAVMILGLCWTPFVDPVSSFFVKTAGFTFVYISFGILLVSFLQTVDINIALNSLFSRPITNLISKIGYSSYSIYTVHFLVINVLKAVILKLHLSSIYLDNKYVFFVVSISASIICGMLLTQTIEKYFLAQRERNFPRRV